MKKLQRDLNIETRIASMVFEAKDPEMNSLGYTLFEDYVKSFKHFIRFKRDFIDTRPKDYSVRHVRDKLYQIAKVIEKNRRYGHKDTGEHVQVT